MMSSLSQVLDLAKRKAWLKVEAMSWGWVDGVREGGQSKQERRQKERASLHRATIISRRSGDEGEDLTSEAFQLDDRIACPFEPTQQRCASIDASNDVCRYCHDSCSDYALVTQQDL